MKSLSKPISETQNQPMTETQEPQGEHISKPILLHNILESLRKNLEISVEPLNPKDLDDLKKTLARLRKHKSFLLVFFIIANVVVFLPNLFSPGYRFLGLGISFFMLIFTLLIMMLQKVNIKMLLWDIEERKKIVGTFKIVKKSCRREKHLNRYNLVFSLPKAREIEVVFDIWNNVEEGDVCYLELSCHHGFVFKLVHNGINVQHQVVQ